MSVQVQEASGRCTSSHLAESGHVWTSDHKRHCPQILHHLVQNLMRMHAMYQQGYTTSAEIVASP
jgi:hypothetical protein